MITNYNELVDSINDELARNDLRDKVPEWIQMAELQLSRFIKLRDGEYSTTVTLTDAATTVTMPDGAKEIRMVQIGTAPDLRTLEVVSWDMYLSVQNNDSSGIPRAIVWQGRTGYIAPTNSGSRNATIYYYGKPEPLSHTNTTNDLLEMGADVLKYWSLLFSAPYIGEDERLATWNSMVAEGRLTLRREYWNSQATAGILRMRNDVVGGDAHWR